MTEYHVAMRTLDGQHIASADVDVEKVGDIGIQREGETAAITTYGDIIATGVVPERARKEKLMLARWSIDKDTGERLTDEDPVLKRF